MIRTPLDSCWATTCPPSMPPSELCCLVHRGVPQEVLMLLHGLVQWSRSLRLLPSSFKSKLMWLYRSCSMGLCRVHSCIAQDNVSIAPAELVPGLNPTRLLGSAREEDRQHRRCSGQGCHSRTSYLLSIQLCLCKGAAGWFDWSSGGCVPGR